MTRPLLIIAVMLGLSAPALAQTRALPPGEIRANGDITFGNTLKLGKREGNKTVITPDTLQILGPGSTGDASLMSAPPNLSAPENSLSGALARRLLLAGNDLSNLNDKSISDKIPFGNTGARTFIHSRRTAPQASILGTAAITRNSTGSGTFGPGAPDYALLTSVQKEDWQTNQTEGEVDGQIVIARQGKKGDTGGILIDVLKRRDTLLAMQPDETGGALGIEMNVGLVDASGNSYHRMHNITGMAETPGAVSLGRGYGSYNETRAGTWFSAYHASSLPEVDDSGNPAAPNGWLWYFTGSKGRAPDSLNFGIDSNGRMHSGVPSARMSVGFETGAQAMTIRDETSNATRARFGRGGDLQLDGQYASFIMSDPVTGGAAGGSHRLTSAGNGTYIYQVSGSATGFGNAKTAFSIAPTATVTVPSLSSATLTMTGLVKLAPYTVATLPTCNATNRDAVAVASDLTTASSTSFRGVPAGGGTVRGPVYCDGASWTVH